MPPEKISGKSFIEVQFPVSKISKESYKERKAAQGQTLTQLGKWWGGKPLVLVRAALIGLLMPTSDNPKLDRDIFFKLMGMDDEGLWRRKVKSIPKNVIYSHLAPEERLIWFEISSHEEPELRQLSREAKEDLQKLVFFRLGYDERISYCCRPEECDPLTPKDWEFINEHLKTHAFSLSSLVQELGIQQFGEHPCVGDAFCGRGSVPFEAARLGCNVVGTDLSPVATLLTWAALNIIGGGEDVTSQCRNFLQDVYDEVDQQVNNWGIEHNSQSWRGYAYLYCNEVVCPECKWKIPLLPTLVIAERMDKVVVDLIPLPDEKRFDIHIKEGCTGTDIIRAKMNGTIKNSHIHCPNPECAAHYAPLSLASIRREGSGSIRQWEVGDIIPRVDDVFQERLYCIRWEEQTSGRPIWHFCAPTYEDLKQEEQVLVLLKERFESWQNNGYVPSIKIEPGDETTRLQRERGWTYWHHLFTPRQLLLLGLIVKKGTENAKNNYDKVILLSSLNRCLDYNSKLAGWNSSHDKSTNTFYNQALNPLYIFTNRGLNYLSISWFQTLKSEKINVKSNIFPIDARNNDYSSHFWITDPPYADAINYHELSEFFLAWYQKSIPMIFPGWVPDSHRALAIKGCNEGFRIGMMESYRNLTQHMPENGMQIVMFTHQDASVWADLTLILWASGLSVTAAWCIQTETGTGGIKKGNYVQGTVLLVLRKKTSNETAFLDEIYPEVESEVKKQLDTMLSIDDKEDPNFCDTDYQLAAYAAALRVLTKYKKIEEIDIDREIARIRQDGEKSLLEAVIANAVKIACDYLVPQGIDSFLWKQLGPEERFYLKGLELESHGEYRNGAYQELARGFGLRSYREMQESSRANETRLRTASEFRDRFLREEGFGNSLVRQVLFAVRQTRQENDTAAGRAWLRGLPNYWECRKDIIGILLYLAAIGSSDTMPQWHEDAKAARLLSSAVEQDHV